MKILMGGMLTLTLARKHAEPAQNLITTSACRRFATACHPPRGEETRGWHSEVSPQDPPRRRERSRTQKADPHQPLQPTPRVARPRPSPTRRSRLRRGWPADLSDDDLLAKLLELNLSRAATQTGRHRFSNRWRAATRSHALRLGLRNEACIRRPRLLAAAPPWIEIQGYPLLAAAPSSLNSESWPKFPSRKWPLDSLQ